MVDADHPAAYNIPSNGGQTVGTAPIRIVERERLLNWHLHKSDVIVGVTLTVLLAACAPSSHGRREIRLEPSAESSHWVQDSRLREIMQELDLLPWATWPQEVEAEYQGAGPPGAAKPFQQAHDLAEGLARGADQIPRAVEHIKMTEVDRRSFLVQVDVFREQAQRLVRDAAQTNREAMRRDLIALNETCLSCHDRFRDFSGPIKRE